MAKRRNKKSKKPSDGTRNQFQNKADDSVRDTPTTTGSVAVTDNKRTPNCKPNASRNSKTSENKPSSISISTSNSIHGIVAAGANTSGSTTTNTDTNANNKVVSSSQYHSSGPKNPPTADHTVNTTTVDLTTT